MREDLDKIIGREEYGFKDVPSGHSFLINKAASEMVVEILRS